MWNINLIRVQYNLISVSRKPSKALSPSVNSTSFKQTTATFQPKDSSASTPPHIQAVLSSHAYIVNKTTSYSILTTAKMSSYFSSYSSSSISNALSSRLTSLRRAITLGDEKDDPENEDCSHISNALRAYYTEKGRPFPAWLPPDPKAPQPSQPTRVVATSQNPNQAPATGAYARAGGGGLGDLWGDSGAQPSPGAQTTSLRRGRGGVAPPLVPMHSAPPGPTHTPSPPLTHAQSHSPTPSGSLHPAGARPLPSQRSGSHQPGQQRVSQDRPGAGSAQERLRARLQGGRSPSPNVDPKVRKPVGGSGSRW